MAKFTVLMAVQVTVEVEAVSEGAATAIAENSVRSVRELNRGPAAMGIFIEYPNVSLLHSEPVDIMEVNNNRQPDCLSCSGSGEGPHMSTCQICKGTGKDT